MKTGETLVKATFQSLESSYQGLFDPEEAIFQHLQSQASTFVWNETSLICCGLALIYGIYVTPLLVTSFAGPSIAEKLYFRFGWPVAFAYSTVILTAACIPLMVALFGAQRSHSGADEKSGITTTGQKLRRLRRLAVELDLPGVCLAIAGLLLCLLPLTHPPGTPGGWPGSTFIVMIIMGIVSLIGFTVWEGELAPVTCVPWRLLRDRNVLGGCLVVMFSGASAASWGFYYLSYLQVVHDVTIAYAGYIVNIHSFTFALSAPLLGL